MNIAKLKRHLFLVSLVLLSACVETDYSTQKQVSLGLVSNHQQVVTSLKTSLQINDRNGFVYLLLEEDVIEQIWQQHEAQIASVNEKAKYFSLFNQLDYQQNKISNELAIRPLGKVANQPFHQVGPHISVRYERTTENKNITPLVELEQAKQWLKAHHVNAEKIFLKGHVTTIKYIPPTRNGALSVIAEIDFDASSQHIMKLLAEAFGVDTSKQYKTHLTIGQSFYPDQLSQEIWQINEQFGPIQRIIEEPYSPAWKQFSKTLFMFKSLMKSYDDFIAMLKKDPSFNFPILQDRTIILFDKKS